MFVHMVKWDPYELGRGFVMTSGPFAFVEVDDANITGHDAGGLPCVVAGREDDWWMAWHGDPDKEPYDVGYDIFFITDTNTWPQERRPLELMARHPWEDDL